MPYFVMKTGMEMFDACRAYGLALVLDTISEVQDLEENETIQDLGMYYSIEGPSIEEIPDLSNDRTWLGLFDFSQEGWSKPFLTVLQPKEREKKKQKIKELLSENISEILEKYKSIHPVEIRSSLSQKEKLKFETLPQSLDTSATKGIKKRVRNSYDEGQQTFVPIEDFALSVLGNVHFIYHKMWKEGANWGSIGILPNPQKIVLRNHLEIQEMLGEKYINNTISTGVTLSHYAVHLAEELRKKRTDQRAYADKYSSLIYNAMMKTGNQWKPISGGLFPLEFLLTLVENNYEISESIFGVWDNLFRNSVKGREDLALSLSDFIIRPSIDTFEEHIKVHLRYLVDEKVKVRIYPKKGVLEVFEHVRS